MGRIRCVDGAALEVTPVMSVDRGGVPYEITLELVCDGESFGAVGERCAYFLTELAGGVAAARAPGSPQAARWADPDDRFPDPPLARAVRAHEAECGHAGPPVWPLPREPELFAFRHRDRDDLAGTGELRCTLRTHSAWIARQADPYAMGGGQGSWRVARRAVIEAWGAGGRGVRAVLTSAELEEFLTGLLAEAGRAGSGCVLGT